MEAFSAETKQEWGSARQPVPDLQAQGPTWSLGPEVPQAGAVLGLVLPTGWGSPGPGAHGPRGPLGRVLPLLLLSSLWEPAQGFAGVRPGLGPRRTDAPESIAFYPDAASRDSTAVAKYELPNLILLSHVHQMLQSRGPHACVFLEESGSPLDVVWVII